MDTPTAATPSGTQPAPAAKTGPSPVVELKPQPGKPTPPKASALAAKPEAGDAKPSEPTYKVKVNGVETEVTLDELKRRYSHRSAADNAFSEGARAKKEAAEQVAKVKAFFEEVKKNPRAFFGDPRIGVDIKKLARDLMAEEIQQQMDAEEEKNLSPEQKRLRELEKWRAEREDADGKAKETAESRQHTEAVEKHKNTLGTQILECLKGAQHLPQNAETAKLVSAEIRRNILEGRPYDVKDVVERLDGQIADSWGKYVRALGPEKAARALTQDVRRALRELDVAEFKKTNPAAAAQGPELNSGPVTKEQPRKRFTETELRNSLGEIDWTERLQRGRDPQGRFVSS